MNVCVCVCVCVCSNSSEYKVHFLLSSAKMSLKCLNVQQVPL